MWWWVREVGRGRGVYVNAFTPGGSQHWCTLGYRKSLQKTLGPHLKPAKWESLRVGLGSPILIISPDDVQPGSNDTDLKEWIVCGSSRHSSRWTSRNLLMMTSLEELYTDQALLLDSYSSTGTVSFFSNIFKCTLWWFMIHTYMIHNILKGLPQSS